MIVYPNAPGGYAIFCDDIREEVGGKNSLIGTYGGDMLLQAELPVMVPQICCFSIIYLDPRAMPSSVSLKVQKRTGDGGVETLVQVALPSVAELPMPELRPSLDDEKHFVILKAALRIAPLPIEGEMALRAIAEIDENVHRLGSLIVRIVDQLPGA